MKIIPRFFSMVLALLAAACGQVNLAVVNLPTRFDGVSVTHDVAFGPEGWQRLDIYAPPGASKGKPLPVIVFYYGGRWEEGSKDDYRFVGSALARQGYITVIPDYRKYPAVKFPVFVEDAARSLAWVSDHIAAYGGRPDSIHIAGHSAGAHIAALLATDARYLKALGKDRSAVIQDFTGLAGPYAFEPDEPDLQAMFGPPDRYPQMQATTFIDGRQPPMLLLWGEKDTAVGRMNMDRLAAAIHARGGCVETRIYPGVDHIWILAGLSWLGGGNNVLQDWIDFIENNTCAGKG